MDLLDFVTAGPKMRKWYGAGERPLEGGGEEPEPEEPDVPSDVVLVTDADSPIGEQVVLQLILARQQLRLLVRDVAAAKTAYGPYATPIPADAVGPRAFKGVKCLVVLGRPGRGLLEAARAARVQHVVLVTAAPSAGGSSGGFSLGGFSLGPGGSAAKELRELADGAAEAALRASGLPYSVVQVYGLVDGQGRNAAAGLAVAQGPPGRGQGGRGVSREALGALISGLVDAVPQRGRTLQAQAPSSGQPGSPQQEQAEAIAAAVQGLAEDP